MVEPHTIQAHIERLRKNKTIELEQVKLLHEWLDRKRSCRQCGRIVGESRTGKTNLNYSRRVRRRVEKRA